MVIKLLIPLFSKVDCIVRMLVSISYIISRLLLRNTQGIVVEVVCFSSFSQAINTNMLIQLVNKPFIVLLHNLNDIEYRIE